MGGKGVKSALSSFGVLRGSLAAEQLSSDPPAFNLKENQAGLLFADTSNLILNSILLST